MAKAFNTQNVKLMLPTSWFRSAKLLGNEAKLSRKHIYILPTRFGWLYALLLLALLTGSINYSLSLGFAMTFLLAGVGLVSILHTWRNLVNLHVSTHRAQAVFSGEIAVFEISVREDNNLARYAVAAKFSNQKNLLKKTISENLDIANDDLKDGTIEDIAALGERIFKLRLISQKRGWLNAPRIEFSTEFPVSLFHVWAYAEIESRCLIYPSPDLNSSVNPSNIAHDLIGKSQLQQGDDDFAGHRNYQFGDSPKRIDWKASSREQGILTKLFQTEATSTLWLDYAATTGSNIELRISQLTHWVLTAERDGLKYGLRLPNLSIKPNSGQTHYHQCLTALALM